MTISQKDVVSFIVGHWFDGQVEQAVAATGFTKKQITNWMNGLSKPQKNNVGWLMHQAVSPEFMVIAEYVTVDTSGSEATVRSQVIKIFKGKEKASGIYAFYDSMANLIYVGKSNGNLATECYTQLKASVRPGVFPKGAIHPKTRLEVVRYISAYFVRNSHFQDHAKHVESLILRISKPALNSYIGHLEKAE